VGAGRDGQNRADIWPAATFRARAPSWHDAGLERKVRRKRSCAMSQRIDQFRETFRLKLMQADSDLSALKAKIDAKAETAERDARACLDEVTKRIEQSEAKVSTARAAVEKWVKEQKTTAKDAATALKVKGETAKLKARAEAAEHYALAAVDVAVAAIDAAEHAALEAWLARRDADHAPSK
jgi:hypothetical protein